MRLVAFASLLLAASSAAAQNGQRVEIDMSSFKYMPSQITLRHGQPYTLHFVNTSGGGHDFVAKTFFAASNVAMADRAHIANGAVELTGGETADIRIVAPGPGRYEAHCSHFMHSTFGMKALIVVT